MKKFFLYSYQAAVNTINHDGVEHAGYMAFLSLLSLFPFMIFMVAMAGFIGASEIGIEFKYILLNNLPPNVALVLKPRIDEIISGPPESLMTLALLGAIWTASSSVEGIRTILNRVYHVIAPPAYIWRRMTSILQFFLLTASVSFLMVLLIIAPILWAKFAELIGISAEFPLNIARYPMIFVALFLFASTLYFMIPNVRLKWREVIRGSFMVVILWFLAGGLLTYYLHNFQQVNFIYGSLGGIIITLLFFYIVNIIFIYGAELNYLYLTEDRRDLG